MWRELKLHALESEKEGDGVCEGKESCVAPAHQWQLPYDSGRVGLSSSVVPPERRLSSVPLSLGYIIPIIDLELH